MSVQPVIRSRVLVFASLVAVALACGSARAADELSPALREDLEAVLKQRANDLLKEKDKDGIPFKRGAYSKNFTKVDDTTYQGTLHQDTVQKAIIDRDQMKVERYLMTIKKTGAKWAIADTKLQDSYDGLYRTQIGSGVVWHFDKFSFDREGLKVTATNGSLYEFSLKGEPTGFRLVADDLAYSYTPPAKMGFYGAAVSNYGLVFDQFVRDHADDIRFKPERLRVDCDAKTCRQFQETAFTGLQKAGDITGSDVPPKLRSVYDEETRDNQKFQKDSPFGGFQPLPDPDNRYWRIGLKRAGGKDHALIVAYDNFDPVEVGIYVTGYGGPILAYNSEDVRKSGVSPYDLESRESEEARDYELRGISGSVDVALEDPVTLSGDITYTMYIKRDLREMPFNISRVRFPGDSDAETKNPKLFINSIRDGDGNELTWVKLGAFGGLVIFPKSIAGGAEVKLRLQFTNLDSIYQLNPTYSAMDRGGWLPFVRFADMIDKFDMTVRTPAKFQVLGIGGKLSDSVKDGVRTTRWASKSAVSFPTIIFGDYITNSSKHQATKLDGTPIPVNVWVDKTTTQGFGDESSDIGAREIRGNQLPAIATQASVALDIYKEVYGVDYPYDKLDLVADPLGAFYGQAPASIIYLGFGVFRGEGMVATDFGGGSGISKFNKDVVAHETGHQWWGSLICNANDRNYWFVESLAEWSSALYVEKVFGPKKLVEKAADWRRNILETNALSNVQDGYSVWGGGGGAAQSNIYNKGPYAFYMLRQTFGDEKFFQFMKDLTTTLKGREIVTRDIQEVAEKSFGGTMEWFFDQWLRGIGLPQYALNYTARKTEDGKWLVEGAIKQRVIYGINKVEIPGKYFRAVAPLTFVAHNGKKFKSKPMLVEGPSTAFKLKIADEPAQVLFNEEGEILAYDLLVNRSW